MSHFFTLHYLQHGTLRQQHAYNALTGNSIMEKLEKYTPVLAGTIPLGIDVESSDLDILCTYTDAKKFMVDVSDKFGHYAEFKISNTYINGIATVVANFYCESFEIEIFGQEIPVVQQAGYRHMIIEHEILLQRGDVFRQEVIKLKNAGYKTEPAFARLLNLEGDPYSALLNYCPI